MAAELLLPKSYALPDLKLTQTHIMYTMAILASESLWEKSVGCKGS